MNERTNLLEATAGESKMSPRTGLLASTFAFALLLSGCKQNPAPKPIDDATLTQEIQSKIAADSSLASDSIQASVRQGVVTLNGSASSDASRNLAGSDAAQFAGIRTVVNNLTVANTVAVASPQPAAPAPVAPAPVAPIRHERPKPAKVPPAIIHQAPEPAVTQPVETLPPPAPIERSTPPTPPAPEVRSAVIPADTTIPVRLSQTLDSATTQEGDTFSAALASDILVDGRVVLRQGTAVSGRVDTVHEAAHFKGSSLLIIQLTNIQARANSLQVSTDTYSKEGNGRGKNSAEKIGGGAAVGAILGGIFGGGKGAGIGAAAGGGVGAGAQAITRGQQVQIPAESLVRFRLTSPVTVRLSGAQPASSEADLQRHN